MPFSDEAMDKLNNSVRTSEVDPNDFVALFVPGGHGSPPEPVPAVSAMHNATQILCEVPCSLLRAACLLTPRDKAGRCSCKQPGLMLR